MLCGGLRVGALTGTQILMDWTEALPPPFGCPSSHLAQSVNNDTCISAGLIILIDLSLYQIMVEQLNSYWNKWLWISQKQIIRDFWLQCTAEGSQSRRGRSSPIICGVLVLVCWPAVFPEGSKTKRNVWNSARWSSARSNAHRQQRWMVTAPDTHIKFSRIS